MYRSNVTCGTYAPLYGAECKPIYVATAYQSMCVVEVILETVMLPFDVTYIDDLDSLIREVCAPRH